MKNWSSKKQTAAFLIITFVVTGIFHWQFIFHGGLENNKNLTLPLMWTPGIVGLLCSLIFGHKLKDIGFGKPKLEHLTLAYAFPAFTSILIFMFLIVFQIDSFGIRSKFIEKYGSTEQVMYAMLVLAPTYYAVIASFRALGEEIGWRGFLHSRLREQNVSHAFIFTGVVWGIWHLPLILFADYATSDMPYLSALLFMIVITTNSVFMGWLREQSGTVWPAALAHGVHNVWVQGVYPTFVKKGPLDPYFGGESGVFLATIYFIAALVIYRKYLNKSGWPKQVT